MAQLLGELQSKQLLTQTIMVLPGAPGQLFALCGENIEYVGSEQLLTEAIVVLPGAPGQLCPARKSRKTKYVGSGSHPSFIIKVGSKGLSIVSPPHQMDSSSPCVVIARGSQEVERH